MAAYTSTQAGDWTNTATWGGTGPPGANDTASVGNAVTITTAITVGNNGGTGGTPAIEITSGGSLFVSGSGSLTISADLQFRTNNATVTFGAGTGLTLAAPASGTCAIDFRSQTGVYLVFNGMSGSHCTLTTNLSNSGSTNGYFTGLSFGNDFGMLTASYTDVSNMGTTTANEWGFGGYTDSGGNVNVSITHCTFTNSNVMLRLGATNNWDGNLTFTSNIFSSSVGNAQLGGASGCLFLNMKNAASSGTRLIQYCGFDKAVVGSTVLGFTCYDCFFNDGYYFSTIALQGANTLQRCLLVLRYSATSTITIDNSATDIYIAASTNANYHYLNNATSSVSAPVWSGFVWECLAGTSAGGDTLLTTNCTSTCALTLQNCIELPGSGGLNFFNMTNLTCSVLHCTLQAGYGANNSAYTGEAGAGTLHELTAFKSNFIYAPSSNSSNLKLYSVASTGGTEDIIAPTSADYNASYNCNLNTPQGGTYNYTNSGNGYGLFESAVPGTHDLGSINPMFVDSTRNIANWGLTQGQASQSATLSYLNSNPSQVINMIRWVRAGFTPQNSALLNATYPGDTLSLDANGYPNNGTIGAMAYNSGELALPFDRSTQRAHQEAHASRRIAYAQ
jgi:hypothetical protein